MDNRQNHLSEFGYREIKSGNVQLFWKGRMIKTISGTEAGNFIDKINQADPETAQLLIAKVTGNFKRGNERLFPPDD
jgi:hypothetical protein